MKRILIILALVLALAMPATTQTKPKPPAVRVLRSIGRNVWKVVRWPVGLALRTFVDGQGEDYGKPNKGGWR